LILPFITRALDPIHRHPKLSMNATTRCLQSAPLPVPIPSRWGPSIFRKSPSHYPLIGGPVRCVPSRRVRGLVVRRTGIVGSLVSQGTSRGRKPRCIDEPSSGTIRCHCVCASYVYIYGLTRSSCPYSPSPPSLPTSFIHLHNMTSGTNDDSQYVTHPAQRVIRQY
jgi:hypothetical protein